ncbi:MAG: hypothetical protein HOV81_13980 [Kofleriaceae bacterium]|nr:hypothetical protein [Kofleriaceae bacterium]
MAPDDHSGARPAGPVVLRIKLRYDDVDAMVQRFAPNVGKSGLFLPTKSIQPIGTEVKFELRLANDTPVLVGMGKVKHVKPPDPKQPRAAFGMAIELTRVSREGREVIIRMIERRRAMGLADVAIPIPEDIDAARRDESQPRAETTGVVREAMSQFASAPVAEQVLTGSPTLTGPVAVAKEPSVPVEKPIEKPVERPSAPLMTSPRPSRSTAEHKAIVALPPEPARVKRPRVADLIAKASELSGPLAAAPMPGLDEQVDVQRALSRARALATGDLDAELAAVRELAAAPIEIGIEAASAELARQLGGKPIIKRDRSAGWARPPAIETKHELDEPATSPSNVALEESASDAELATSISSESVAETSAANALISEPATSAANEPATTEAQFAAKTRAETEIAPSAVIADVTTAAVQEGVPVEAPLVTDEAPISMRAPSSEPIDEANVLESVPVDRVEPAALEPEMIDRDAHRREGYERDASQPSAELAAVVAAALAVGTDEEEPMELDEADLVPEDDDAAAAEYEQDQRTRVPSGDESYNLYARLSPESAAEVMREFDRGADDDEAAREFDRDLRTRVPSGDEDYRAMSPVAHMMISDDADVAEFQRALDDAPEHLNSNESELADSTQIGAMPVDPNGDPATQDSLADQLDQQLAQAEQEADAELQLGMQQQAYDVYGQPVAPAVYGQPVDAAAYGQPVDPATYGQPVDPAAYGQDGYQQGGYEQGGYQDSADEQGGYQQGGYEQSGYEQSGYQQGGYEQSGYQPGGYQQGGDQQGGDQDGAYAQAAEDEGEEISDLDVLAEADEDDADLLGASGEQDSLDRAPAYAEPPYQTPEYEKQDPDAIAPQDRPSFDFANALDLGDDSAQHSLDDLHGSHAPMRPKRRSSAGDFDAPSNSYTFAESFPQAPGPSLDEALGSALDEDAADEFDEPHSYAQRQAPVHQPSQPQRHAPAPAQPQRHAPADPKRPISEPQYLRNPDDLEDALAALDVDLDDISLDQQRSRRVAAPSQRPGATSQRPLPGLPIHRPSDQSRPIAHTVPRTPTGQQPALRPPNARDLEDPPSTQYVLKRPATGHDTLLPTKKAIKPAPAPKRASTNDDGIIIDFDDDLDE